MFGVCLSVLDLTLCVLSLVWEGNRNHVTAVSSMCIVLGVGCICSCVDTCIDMYWALIDFEC